MKFCKRIFSFFLVMVLFAGAAAIDVSAKGGRIKSSIGWINANRLNLRVGATTSSSVLATATRDEVVVVLGKTGTWYKVIYNMVEGYMHASYVRTLVREDVELGYGRINGDGVNLRSGPGTGNKIVDKAYTGDKAYIIGFNTGWYKVIFGQNICYVRSDYLDLTEIPYENKASTKSPLFFRGGKSTGVAPSAAALNGSTATSTGEKIVATARKYLGVPYVWAGSTPSGFDCSGFTQYVMKENGITIPRTTDTQYGVGTYVAKSNLQPGDLVFFQNTYREGISHVGIYIGNNQFIHASTSAGVTVSNLSSSYYASRYYGARRVI